MPTDQILEQHVHPKFPRLYVRLRSRSKFFQAWTYLDGKGRRTSLKTATLETAMRMAEDWYRRELKASQAAARQHPIDLVLKDPTIQELFTSYSRTLDEKKQAYADQKWDPIAEFWRARKLSTISPKTFREFYVWRRRNFRKFKNADRGGLSNSTLHKDKILIRQILKHAAEEGLVDRLPVIPKHGKIEANPRPWFSAAEWQKLVKVGTERIFEAKGNPKVYRQRLDLLELILFLYGSMFRVNEVQKNLRFKDCRVEKNDDGEKMLICELRKGKTGGRTVVGTNVAAEVYERRLKRTDDKTGVIFPERKKDAFTELLIAAELRYNQEGFVRNLKSLRPTSISTRMLENPDLNPLFISRNAGVGLGVIDAYYAKRLTAEMKKNELSKAQPATLEWHDRRL